MYKILENDDERSWGEELVLEPGKDLASGRTKVFAKMYIHNVQTDDRGLAVFIMKGLARSGKRLLRWVGNE